MSPEFASFDAHYDRCPTCQRERRCELGARLWAAWLAGIEAAIDAEVAA